MEQIIGCPAEGTLFAAYLEGIMGSRVEDLEVEYYGHEVEKFSKKIDHLDFNGFNPETKTILLFKYLGDGLCQEAYTGIIMNLYSSDEETKSLIETYSLHQPEVNSIYKFVSTSEEFMKNYQKVFNHPLCVFQSTNYDYAHRLFDIDDLEVKRQFAENVGHEEAIKMSLRRLEQTAREELKKSLNNVIADDYVRAYTENNIRSFDSSGKGQK